MAEKISHGAPDPGIDLKIFPMPPSAVFLGYEHLSIDRDEQTARARFQATEKMLNPAGTVQGGILTAMLDDAMGFMVVALTGKGVSSMNINTQYFRPGLLGPLIAKAKVTHMGKSTVFTKATLYNEAGEKIAAATQTARMITLPRVGDV